MWCCGDGRMKSYLFVCLAFGLIAVLSSGLVSAIPESDLYKFKSSVRGYAKFDEYGGSTATRSYEIKSFYNESDSFYFVIRASAGDIKPYDDFFVRVWCSGDSLPTEFHTTDYDSWVSNGQITFKRNFYTTYSEVYDNLSIPAEKSGCEIYSASGLVVDNNAGYTTFYVEMVPILPTAVITLDAFCADEKRVNITGRLTSGILIVLQNNTNFLYTMWIIVQVLAVIIIVIGVPVFILLMIRWAIWRITDFKLLERSTNG
jgi:hypothetical protein